MATQKAVVITAPKEAKVVSDRSIPTLRDDYILVKTVSLALNPTAYKHIEFLAPPGVLVSCGYAGIVQEVGKDVKKPFKKGDRICGFVHGSNAVQLEDGAFAEYIMEAATLGLGVITAGQALFQSLKLAPLNNPIKNAQRILIYEGFNNHRHFGNPKLGADATFDYHDANAAVAINEATKNGLKLAFDTVSTESTAEFCSRALSTEGGDYSTLLPIKIERQNVVGRTTMAYTAFGEGFQFGKISIPANLEHKAFAESLYSVVEKLLEEGKVKAHPPRSVAVD
ncbi:hypothetical protein BBP40_003128 [Aspergillus hancockii]|nr:hypothetical protein BBP40_003128 [Aspergillus hancockii]